MKWLALPGILTTAALPTAQRQAHGPWLLTALPSMGTVTWRCDPARARANKPSLALGFRAFASSATDDVVFRAGRSVLRRTMQPGDSWRLPYVRALRQRLLVEQGTEPGTLRAVVDVDFSPRPALPSHCWSYLPPALTVRVYPR